MAITKADAKTPTKAEMGAVDVLEINIDAYLMGKDTPVYYQVDGISPRVLREIETRYRAAGWMVECVCDQREGTALKFS